MSGPCRSSDMYAPSADLHKWIDSNTDFFKSVFEDRPKTINRAISGGSRKPETTELEICASISNQVYRKKGSNYATMEEILPEKMHRGLTNERSLVSDAVGDLLLYQRKVDREKRRREILERRKRRIPRTEKEMKRSVGEESFEKDHKRSVQVTENYVTGNHKQRGDKSTEEKKINGRLIVRRGTKHGPKERSAAIKKCPSFGKGAYMKSGYAFTERSPEKVNKARSHLSDTKPRYNDAIHSSLDFLSQKGEQDMSRRIGRSDKMKKKKKGSFVWRRLRRVFHLYLSCFTKKGLPNCDKNSRHQRKSVPETLGSERSFGKGLYMKTGYSFSGREGSFSQKMPSCHSVSKSRDISNANSYLSDASSASVNGPNNQGRPRKIYEKQTNMDERPND